MSKFSKELVESVKKLDENKLNQLIIDSGEIGNKNGWWLEKRLAEIIFEIATNEKNIREDTI